MTKFFCIAAGFLLFAPAAFALINQAALIVAQLAPPALSAPITTKARTLTGPRLFVFERF